MGYFQSITKVLCLERILYFFLIILLKCTEGLNCDGNECHLQQQSIWPLQQMRSIYSYSSLAFLGSPTELTQIYWRVRGETSARKADVEQCTLSAAISQSAPKSATVFFIVILCPNWMRPPLMSSHRQQTQPHGKPQSLLSTDLTGVQKQGNIARESSVSNCFTLGTS